MAGLRRLLARPRGARAVATIGTGAISPVLDLTLPTIRRYAERHRYDLVVGGPGHADGRPEPWAKINLLRELLHVYETVLWIDADAVIVDDTDDLADLVPADAVQAIVQFETPEGLVPNTGVWLLRSGLNAQRFLDLVWSREEYAHHKWWENAAVIDLLGYDLEPTVRPARPSPWLARTHFLPEEWNVVPHVSKVERPRIKHYAGTTNEDRVRLISADLADLAHR